MAAIDLCTPVRRLAELQMKTHGVCAPCVFILFAANCGPHFDS